MAEIGLIGRIGYALGFNRKSAEVHDAVVVSGTSQNNPEKRSITGTGWELLKLLTGAQNKSGVRANSVNSLGLPAAFACIKHVSEAVAVMPVQVHKRQSDKVRLYVSGHQAARLLNQRSNRITNAFDIKRDMIALAMIYPSSYVLIERDPISYKPISLWLKQSTDVEEITNSAKTNRIYKIKGIDDYVAEENIIRLTNMFGRSVVDILNEAFGTSIATQSFAAQYFANNGNVQRYATTPNQTRNTTQKDNIETDLGSKFGPNAQGLPLLEYGIEVKELKGASMSDSQALETRKWQAEDVCRIFKVPPAIIGLEAGARYNSVEMTNTAFLQNAVLPWITVCEQEFHEKLLTESEKETHYFKFQTEALLRPDLKTRIESYKAMQQMGWTINEIRELEDYDPIEGGDNAFIQVNQIPLGKAEEYADVLISKGAQPNTDNNAKL